ncbi:MAG: DNA adenine methylase [Candidatus Thorarchaeota archaeon]
MVKWAGGKTQILSRLRDFIPEDFGTYYEPFLGGGAFFFYLFRIGALKESILADFNSDLIMLYTIIRDHTDDLVRELKYGKYLNNRIAYVKIRDTFNRCKKRRGSKIRQAARMLYLNKVSYNGLYRVNAKGEFNVPFGRHKNPRILDEGNLMAVGKALRSVDLFCADFSDSLSTAREGDFIYLDPPYAPLNSTSVFTSYIEGGFDYEQQERLANCFSGLSEKGCYVLQSNSATDYIRNLYADFRMEEIHVARPISSKVSTRNSIQELLISNFEPQVIQKKPPDL